MSHDVPAEDCCQLLVLAIQGKQDEAFAIFQKRFRTAVVGRIRGMLGNHQDVADIEQIAWTKAWKGRAGLDPNSGCAGICAWVRTIAHHEAITWLDAHPVQPPLPEAIPFNPRFGRDPFLLIEWLRLSIQVGVDTPCQLFVFLLSYLLRRTPETILSARDLTLSQILQDIVEEGYAELQKRKYKISRPDWDELLGPLAILLKQPSPAGGVLGDTTLADCAPQDAGQISDWVFNLLLRLITALRKSAVEFLILLGTIPVASHKAVTYCRQLTCKPDPINLDLKLHCLVNQSESALHRTLLNPGDAANGLGPLRSRLCKSLLARAYAVPNWSQCIARKAKQIGDTFLSDYPPVLFADWRSAARLGCRDALRAQGHAPTYLPFCEYLMKAENLKKAGHL